jgi:DNA-binding transcriptional ArsR family regulator
VEIGLQDNIVPLQRRAAKPVDFSQGKFATVSDPSMRSALTRQCKRRSIGLTNSLINQLNASMTSSLDKTFEALASQPRRKIMAMLTHVELTTSELADKLAISAPATSRHLSVLENAGLVTSERRGQFVFYKLNADSLVNHLSGFMFEICPTAGPLKRASKALAKKRATK